LRGGEKICDGDRVGTQWVGSTSEHRNRYVQACKKYGFLKLV